MINLKGRIEIQVFKKMEEQEDIRIKWATRIKICTNLTVSQVDTVETSQYIPVTDFLNVNIFTPLLTLNTNTSCFWIWI